MSALQSCVKRWGLLRGVPHTAVGLEYFGLLLSSSYDCSILYLISETIPRATPTAELTIAIMSSVFSLPRLLDCVADS